MDQFIVEGKILEALHCLEDESTETHKDVAACKKCLTHALKEIHKGKWVIQAKCEDGVCYAFQAETGTVFWHIKWWEAKIYATEVEARTVIASLKETPTDIVMGSFKAVQL